MNWYYPDEWMPDGLVRRPHRFARWLGDDFFRCLVAVNVSHDREPRFGADDLRRLVQVEKIQWLGLDEHELTDADMLYLSRLKRLERLFLAKAPITDAGLAHLADLTNLRYLGLSETRITDDGLAHLRHMTKL